MPSSWPPPPFDDAHARMREWDAWYTGDPERLVEVYTGERRRAVTPRLRPSTYRGGLVGGLARFFWGRPVPVGQTRQRLHVPLAADIATASADLLFSEPPRIVVDDTAAQTRLDLALNSPAMHSRLLEAAEIASALGGAYLRVVWDADVAEHAMLDAVHADAAVPEWRWGELSAVTFYTRVRVDGPAVWRHLERYEPGRIVHELHVGTDTELGRVVPLAESPTTEWAAPLVDAEGSIATGTDRLAAAYVPNVRPNRVWRGTPQLAPLGRSDFDGVEGLFDALDEVYTSWMRDVRIAKARLLVPTGYLQDNGAGRGASFDEDREVYTELNALSRGGSDTLTVSAHQFAIRVAEHRDTAEDITRTALRAAGYSLATLGDNDGDASITATEVTAREKLSNRTRDKKARYWASGLAHVSAALVEIDRAVFGGTATVSDLPKVEFPDRTQPDPEALARTVQALGAAESASTDVRVRTIHPDWDDDQVRDEVAAILAESGRTVPDPAKFRGLDQFPDPPTPGDDKVEGAANAVGTPARS
ncbi:phage portal protein [Amycolatopsis japonica]|uniref:phage portal protein n=1 Tax=Amycolatopsis japonica TaxID=208439 RepID=UPI003325AA31